MYLDEITFTKRSFQTKDYSQKGDNQKVDQQRVYSGYHCAVVTVSAEKGLEGFEVYARAVKGPDFAKHLRKLRKIHGDTPLAILMDQLNVHSAKNVVMPLYTQLNIK